MAKKTDTPEKTEPSAADEALNLYGDAIAATRAIYRALERPAGARPQALPQAVAQGIISVFKRSAGGPNAVPTENGPDSKGSELLVLTERSTPDNYLYSHAVNVCILSVALGVHRGLNDEALLPLAFGALLHDLGMGLYLPLVLKKEKLSDEEKNRIQQYPKESQKLLSFFPDLAGETRAVVTEIVGQIHERVNGQGYPDKRQTDDIHPLARVVGVCDVYEAVTHPRPWRPRALPHDALRFMIEEQEDLFEPSLVKSLIELLGLYPPGSFVRLNTGETGRVVRTRLGLPSRPKIKLFSDQAGGLITPPRYVDLAIESVRYVVEPVDETRITSTDKRFAAQLRAQRLWIRGM